MAEPIAYDDPRMTELARAATSMECAPYVLPGEKAPRRLDRAQALCIQGAVVQNKDHSFNVQGSSRIYRVLPSGCECPQSSRGRSRYCYHLVAAVLYDRWQGRLLHTYKSAFIGASMPRVDQAIENAEMAEEEAALLGWDVDADAQLSGNLFPTEDDDAAVAEHDTHMTAQEPQEATQPALATQGQIPPLAQLQRSQGAPGGYPFQYVSPPQRGGRAASPLRPLAAIIADLSRPLPKECVATRQQQGQTLSYLHWWDVRLLLDTYAPGWHGEIVEVQEAPREVVDRQGTVSTVHCCTVRYRLSIPCAEGVVSREALGREEAQVVQYGDHTSNASAMALARAAAMFGVGVWLREKDGTSTALQRHLLAEALAALGGKWESQGHDKQEALAALMQAHGVTRRDALPLWTVRQALGERL